MDEIISAHVDFIQKNSRRSLGGYNHIGGNTLPIPPSVELGRERNAFCRSNSRQREKNTGYNTGSQAPGCNHSPQCPVRQETSNYPSSYDPNCSTGRSSNRKSYCYDQTRRSPHNEVNSHRSEAGAFSKSRASSPVEIREENITKIELPPLYWDGYDKVPKVLTLTNTGRTVLLTGQWHHGKPFINGGPLNGSYIFSQVHFHSPSEHEINGRRFPLEMHVVHYKTCYLTQERAMHEKDGTVVLVYLFQVMEKYNTILSNITSLRDYIKDSCTKKEVAKMSLDELVQPFTSNYFLYWGSVSSKNNSYLLQWVINCERLPVSQKEVNDLISVLDTTGCLTCNNGSRMQPENNAIFYVGMHQPSHSPKITVSGRTLPHTYSQETQFSAKSKPTTASVSCSCKSSSSPLEDDLQSKYSKKDAAVNTDTIIICKDGMFSTDSVKSASSDTPPTYRTHLPTKSITATNLSALANIPSKKLVSTRAKSPAPATSSTFKTPGLTRSPSQSQISLLTDVGLSVSSMSVLNKTFIEGKLYKSSLALPHKAPTEGKLISPNKTPTEEKSLKSGVSLVSNKTPTEEKSLKSGVSLSSNKTHIEEKSLKSGQSLSSNKTHVEEKSLKSGQSLSSNKTHAEEKSLKSGQSSSSNKAPAEEKSLKSGQSLAPSKTPLEEILVKSGQSLAPNKTLTEEKSLKSGQTLAPSKTPIEEKSLKSGQTLAPSKTPIEEKSLKSGQTLAPSKTPIEEKSLKSGQTLAPSKTPIEEILVKSGQSLAPTKTLTEEKSFKSGQSLSPSKAPAEEKSLKSGQSLSPSKAPAEEKSLKSGQSLPQSKALVEEKSLKSGQSLPSKTPIDEDSLKSGQSSPNKTLTEEKLIKSRQSSTPNKRPTEEMLTKSGYSIPNKSLTDGKLSKSGQSSPNRTLTEDKLKKSSQTSTPNKRPTEEKLTKSAGSTQNKSLTDGKLSKSSQPSQNKSLIEEKSIITSQMSTPNKRPTEEKITKSSSRSKIPPEEKSLASGRSTPTKSSTEEKSFESIDALQYKSLVEKRPSIIQVLPSKSPVQEKSSKGLVESKSSSSRSAKRERPYKNSSTIVSIISVASYDDREDISEPKLKETCTQTNKEEPLSGNSSITSRICRTVLSKVARYKKKSNKSSKKKPTYKGEPRSSNASHSKKKTAPKNKTVNETYESFSDEDKKIDIDDDDKNVQVNFLLCPRNLNNINFRETKIEDLKMMNMKKVIENDEITKVMEMTRVEKIIEKLEKLESNDACAKRGDTSKNSTPQEKKLKISCATKKKIRMVKNRKSRRALSKKGNLFDKEKKEYDTGEKSIESKNLLKEVKNSAGDNLEKECSEMSNSSDSAEESFLESLTEIKFESKVKLSNEYAFRVATKFSPETDERACSSLALLPSRSPIVCDQNIHVEHEKKCQPYALKIGDSEDVDFIAKFQRPKDFQIKEVDCKARVLQEELSVQTILAVESKKFTTEKPSDTIVKDAQTQFEPLNELKNDLVKGNIGNKKKSSSFAHGKQTKSKKETADSEDCLERKKYEASRIKRREDRKILKAPEELEEKKSKTERKEKLKSVKSPKSEKSSYSTEGECKCNLACCSAEKYKIEDRKESRDKSRGQKLDKKERFALIHKESSSFTSSTSEKSSKIGKKKFENSESQDVNTNTSSSSSRSHSRYVSQYERPYTLIPKLRRIDKRTEKKDVGTIDKNESENMETYAPSIPLRITSLHSLIKAANKHESEKEIEILRENLYIGSISKDLSEESETFLHLMELMGMSKQQKPRISVCSFQQNLDGVLGSKSLSSLDELYDKRSYTYSEKLFFESKTFSEKSSGSKMKIYTDSNKSVNRLSTHSNLSGSSPRPHIVVIPLEVESMTNLEVLVVQKPDKSKEHITKYNPLLKCYKRSILNLKTTFFFLFFFLFFFFFFFNTDRLGRQKTFI